MLCVQMAIDEGCTATLVLLQRDPEDGAMVIQVSGCQPLGQPVRVQADDFQALEHGVSCLLVSSFPSARI